MWKKKEAPHQAADSAQSSACMKLIPQVFQGKIGCFRMLSLEITFCHDLPFWSIVDALTAGVAEEWGHWGARGDLSLIHI